MDEEKLEDGISLLFFYTLRGTNKQLHSRATHVCLFFAFATNSGYLNGIWLLMLFDLFQKLEQILQGIFDGSSNEKVHDASIRIMMKTMDSLIGFALPKELMRTITIELVRNSGYL